MRWSRLFLPTLRENPAEVEGVSRQLLLRAGYIRNVGPGIYSYLLLGARALEKIAQIARHEMEAIGAQEIRLPVLHPAASVIASIAAGELRSYRQLPQIWHHIQPKIEAQKHARADLLRARQILVSESYSFDIDETGRSRAYQRHCEAYSKIFERCGLKVLAAETHSGASFAVPSDSGEHFIVRCAGCGYAADLDQAAGPAVPPPIVDPTGDFAPEPFHTPGRKTIADVAEFTGLPETSQMKSLVLVADGRPVLALVRGDHSLNEAKFAHAMKAAEFRPASVEEIRKWFGAEAGSLGPVGVRNMRIVADEALRGRKNMIAGANQDDYHLRHVTPGEDFEPEYIDLRQVSAGDGCPHCGGALELTRSIEIGRIGKAGCGDAAAIELKVQNEARQDTDVKVGSYTIFLDRVLSAAVEQHHDPDGMALPAGIAPFDVVITPVSVADGEALRAAEEIYEGCRKMELDALLDDRDERPGVKFKDADLIGIPYRITLGKKLKEGMVEVMERRTKEREDVARDQAAAFVAGKARS